MLPVVYDPVLVTASILVAIMASFTGLRLASGLGRLGVKTRKVEVSKAAVALGGGIWSMHFVAMLAIQIPVQIQYEALATLGSVLVAILVTGLGLIFLHFGERNARRIVIAGIFTGLGILLMHYMGMSAIGGNCIVTFEPLGYLVTTVIAISASIAALWMAYRQRTLSQIALGAVLLGLTVCAMHYSAMLFTRFSRTSEVILIDEPNLTSGALALVVAFATFLICGLFLLTAIPVNQANDEGANLAETAAAEIDTDEVATLPAIAEAEEETPQRLPYEINHTTRFLTAEEVSVVRADGHYTWLNKGDGEVFCPWPISKVTSTFENGTFLQTHRSYLVNLTHVQGFEREGDKSYCLVGREEPQRVPVSRSRSRAVKEALSLG